MNDEILASLPESALDAYIDRYERGGVQRRPRLRFVDGGGRACPAAALADAGSSAEFMNGDGGAGFRGSVLERISRAFEDGELDAGDLYRDCLLERAVRGGSRDGHAAGDRRAATAETTVA